MLLPQQPLEIAQEPQPHVRFRGNAVVLTLMRAAEHGMQVTLADLDLRQFPIEDVEQFFQLVGYSVTAFERHPLVRVSTIEEVDRRVERMHGFRPRDRAGRFRG